MRLGQRSRKFVSVIVLLNMTLFLNSIGNNIAVELERI